MPNLITELSISLVVITNWTGVQLGTKELGYVATNHVANVCYEGEKYEFPIKTTGSDVAVWRLAPNYSFTNSWIQIHDHGFIVTNELGVITFP